MTNDTARYPRYRWFVLGIAWITIMTIHWSWYIVPSLAYCLFPDLSLTHAQFTLLITGPTLTAVFVSIPGGALGDRYGIRLVVAVAAFLAGIFGLARAFAPGFNEMFALMCLCGISFGFAIPNLPKLVSIWFPSRQIGLASGIYTTAMGTGLSLGLLTGPLFGSWKPAFIYTGIATLVIAILWTLFSRNAPKGVEIRMLPMISGIKRGIKSKNVWLIGIMMLLNYGVLVAFSGNLPEALESMHHVNPEKAGAISSLLTWGIVAGNFVIPLASDRIGLRKPFLYVCSIVAATCLFFAWRLAPSFATSALTFPGGFSIGGIASLLFALPVELPEIGHEHVGGAAGIVVSLGNMGAFLIPFMVISPFMAMGALRAYNVGFSVMSVLFVMTALIAIPLKETGIRRKK